MLKTILSILVLCFSMTLQAQQVSFEKQVAVRKSRQELQSFGDRENKLTAVFLSSTDSISGLLFNEKMEVLRNYQLARVEGENLAGGFFRDGKIILLLDNRGEKILHLWTLDIQGGSAIENPLSFDIKKEKPVAYFNCGDHFVYFTESWKTREFTAYDFSNDSSFHALRYGFDENTWDDFTRSQGLGRDLDVQKVEPVGECGAEVAQCPSKIYFQNDSLLLISNKRRGLSAIYGFDLLHRNIFARKIQHFDPQHTVYLPEFVNNSFLLKDKLYYVWANSESLGLQVCDFYTGQILKKFENERSKDIPFKNTPIMQEGGGTIYSGGQVRELGTTKQLLRKMVNGQAVIIAHPNDSSQVELLVGSFKRLYPASGGAFVPSGFGPGSAPSMIFIPSLGFSSNGWTKSARFKMRLDGTSNEFVPGEMSPSINDRIDDYTEAHKLSPLSEILFTLGGRYYYGYYEKKEGKLVIIRF